MQKEKGTLWWNKRFGKVALCPISQCRLRPGKNKYGLSYTVKLKCKHSFYRSALFTWVLNSLVQPPLCPLCRREFVPVEVFI